MQREIIIKHLNNAIELQNAMDKDPMLRSIYSDLDLDRFIDKCNDLLHDQFEEIGNMEIPFEFQGVI